MDTNVNEEVDMDLLVKENPDPIEDYKEEVNKDVVDQDPDPDQVVKADLEMDPAAATEKFIRKHFGMSAEELEEEADTVAEAAAEEDTTTASDVNPEDALLGIEPAAEETTVVAVTPPAGGETEVITDGGVETPATDVGTDVVTEEAVVAASEPETAAEVSSLENLRMLFSREDEDVAGDEPDVSLNVETPNNNVDIDLDDKAVTIEPVEEGTSDEAPSEDAGSSDVPAPETEEDNSSEEPEAPAEGESEGGESDTDNSAESWWFV